jgi:nicotinamidase-related amidase
MPLPDMHTAPQYDRSALITIDIQNDTLDHGVMEIAGTSAILPSINRLCRTYRRAGRPIVHLIRIYTEDAADADRCRRSALLSGDRRLMKGSHGRRPADELLPNPTLSIDDDRLLNGEIQSIGPDEAIIFKPRWGAFYRTPLASHLREKGVSTLVFGGCNFPNCTRVSICEASERDFRITAAVDAISAITPSDVTWLENIGVNCATTEEICRFVGNATAAVPTNERMQIE